MNPFSIPFQIELLESRIAMTAVVQQHPGLTFEVTRQSIIENDLESNLYVQAGELIDLDNDHTPERIVVIDETLMVLSENNEQISVPLEGVHGFAHGDFNNDGTSDLLTRHLAPDRIEVFLGTIDAGIYRFAAVEDFQILYDVYADLELADLNNDGVIDLITERFNAVEMRLGRGDGTFGESIQFVSGRINPVSAIGITDIDNDGDIDIVVGSTDAVSVVRNDNGIFETEVFFAPVREVESVTMHDMNDDGFQDLLIGSRRLITIFYAGENSGFDANGHEIVAPGTPSKLIVTDVNGDNRDDIVFSHSRVRHDPIWYENTMGVSLALQLAENGFSRPLRIVENFGVDVEVITDSRRRTAIVSLDRRAISTVLVIEHSRWRPIATSFVQAVRRPNDARHYGDLNGDARIDFVIANHLQELSVYLSVPDGSFNAVTVKIPNNPVYVRVGNFDRDPADEILIGDRPIGHLLVDVADGFKVTEFESDVVNPKAPHVADFNSDGIDDLLISAGFNSVYIYFGTEDGEFRDREHFASFPVQRKQKWTRTEVEIDLNGDDAIEFVEFAGGYSHSHGDVSPVVVREKSLESNGTELSRTLFSPMGIRQVAVMDVDNDGDSDLVTQVEYGIMVVYNAQSEILSGDANADGEINVEDIDHLCQQIARDDAQHHPFDYNRDGAVDARDVDTLVHLKFGTAAGDVNLDRIFNSKDLVEVFRSGEYEDESSFNSYWSTGDWNCDGEFTSADLVVAFERNLYESTAFRAKRLSDVALAIAGHYSPTKNGDSRVGDTLRQTLRDSVHDSKVNSVLLTSRLQRQNREHMLAVESRL